MSDPAPFAKNGFAILPAFLDEKTCAHLAAQVLLGPSAVGTRCLLQQDWCSDLAGQLRHHPLLASHLGPDSVAVQCNYFEKSLHQNWLVPMHQDVSVSVAARSDDVHLRGWSSKEGVLSVQPPAALLEALIAILMESIFLRKELAVMRNPQPGPACHRLQISFT